MLDFYLENSYFYHYVLNTVGIRFFAKPGLFPWCKNDISQLESDPTGINHPIVPKEDTSDLLVGMILIAAGKTFDPPNMIDDPAPPNQQQGLQSGQERTCVW
jgi:hypothetical protein